MNTIKAKRILESLETFSRRKKRLQENYKSCVREEKRRFDRVRPKFECALNEAYMEAAEELVDNCQDALEACYCDGDLCYVVRDVCEPDGSVKEHADECDVDCTVDCLISILREKLGDRFDDVMRGAISRSVVEDQPVVENRRHLRRPRHFEL